MQSSVGEEADVLAIEHELLKLCKMISLLVFVIINQGVLYICAFFAASEPPTAAATMARDVTKASATLKIKVVERGTHKRLAFGNDGFSSYETCKPSGK